MDLGYGGTIHWYMRGSEHDGIEVGMDSLTVMAIELRGVAGNKIDLKGGHGSCTFLFDM